MNKNIVIGIVAAVIILGGFVLIAQKQNKNTAQSNSPSKGVLTAQESAFDFGTISMAAGKVTHSFAVKNTGNEPVILEKMYTSCMCTTALLMVGGKKFGPFGMQGHGFTPKLNKTFNPGQDAIIEVVFDPTAHGPAGIGNIQRAVVIENNTGNPLELQISAVVTP